MICRDARERFSSLVDEVLAPAERAGLDDHLAECPECRKELERFQSTVALLHRLDPPRAPAGFVDRVLAAARPAKWYRRFFEGLFVPFSVKLPAEAAALLLISGLAVFVFQRTPELERVAREGQFQPVTPPETAAKFPAPTPASPAAEAPAAERAERPRAPEAPDRSKSQGTRNESRRSPGEALGSAAPAAPEPAPPSLAPEALPGVGSIAESKKETVTGGGAPAAPAERRADSAKDKVMRSPAAPPSAMQALPSADVTGELTVTDRAAAERAIGEALTRSGGAILGRREDAGTTVMEVSVPGRAYPEFARSLARLGAWRQQQSEPTPLPPSVRVTLHLVD